jgi:hypothetical protein
MSYEPRVARLPQERITFGDRCEIERKGEVKVQGGTETGILGVMRDIPCIFDLASEFTVPDFGQGTDQGINSTVMFPEDHGLRDGDVIWHVSEGVRSPKPHVVVRYRRVGLVRMKKFIADCKGPSVGRVVP